MRFCVFLHQNILSGCNNAFSWQKFILNCVGRSRCRCQFYCFALLLLLLGFLEALFSWSLFLRILKMWFEQSFIHANHNNFSVGASFQLRYLAIFLSFFCGKNKYLTKKLGIRLYRIEPSLYLFYNNNNKTGEKKNKHFFSCSVDNRKKHWHFCDTRITNWTKNEMLTCIRC